MLTCLHAFVTTGIQLHGRPADRVVYAGVIGIGCTIGIRKMARISHPISESELENAVNWFFSVDNINAASDRVLQLMDRLELPKLLQRTPGRSHTSSDGQKFEVRVDSLKIVKLTAKPSCSIVFCSISAGRFA